MRRISQPCATASDLTSDHRGRPVRPTPRARRDYYLGDAGTAVALRFVDAVERVISQISRSPLSGSLRFSYELEIPDLRVRPVARFPYLVFYVVGDETVDVWRILHSRRDIPSAISGFVAGTPATHS
jgi:toxin ParE1/3/4